MFKKELLKFIRPEASFIYNIHDPVGLKLLRKLGLSHLGDHELRQNFQGRVCSVFTCRQDTEKTTNFILHSPNHHCASKTLF